MSPNMNINKVIVAIFSLLLIMVGIDKFFPYLPPCSLLADVNPMVWRGVGVLQLTAGLLVWNKKFSKPIALIMLGVMIYFIIRHLVDKSLDIGGAAFMAVLAINIIADPWSKIFKK